MDVTRVPLEEIARWICEAGEVVALTGAGISTESGIPDFRGPSGVWTKDPKAERLSHIAHYVSDPEVRVLAWKSRLAHPAWTARPSAGHEALVELERKGHLDLVITQNVDGLQQAAGTEAHRLVEIHGTIREVECLSCGERAPMERALARVRAGEADPPCRSCGGILKSATVSFGQPLKRDDLVRAERAARSCDVMLAIGTSLTVFPVAALPAVALRAGARLVIVNEGPTEFDGAADAVVHDRIGAALPKIATLV